MSDGRYEIYYGFTQERIRQKAKWGKQSHPMVPREGVDGFGYDPSSHMVADDYEVPTADRAKFLCDSRAERGGLTWFAILVEEVSEAIEAAVLHGDTSEELEQELTQTGAVVVAMLEDLRERREGH